MKANWFRVVLSFLVIFTLSCQQHTPTVPENKSDFNTQAYPVNSSNDITSLNGNISYASPLNQMPSSNVISLDKYNSPAYSVRFDYEDINGKTTAVKAYLTFSNDYQFSENFNRNPPSGYSMGTSISVSAVFSSTDGKNFTFERNDKGNYRYVFTRYENGGNTICNRGASSGGGLVLEGGTLIFTESPEEELKGNVDVNVSFKASGSSRYIGEFPCHTSHDNEGLISGRVSFKAKVRYENDFDLKLDRSKVSANPDNTDTDYNHATITLKAEDDANWTLYANEDVIDNGSGSRIYHLGAGGDLKPEDGNYTIRLVDETGNEKRKALEVDSTPPKITDVDVKLTYTRLNITATVEDEGSGVREVVGLSNLSGDERFSRGVYFFEGTVTEDFSGQQFVIEAYDRFSNYSKMVVSLNDCGTPTPEPTRDPGDGDGGGIVTLSNKFSVQNYSAPCERIGSGDCESLPPSKLSHVEDNNEVLGNAAESVPVSWIEDFNKLSNQIDKLEEKLNGFTIQAKGPEQRRSEIEAQIATLKSQREHDLSYINYNLSNYKLQRQYLRYELNQVRRDNNFSVDGNKPYGLQEYKDKIVELEEEFESLVNSGNTYGLTEASNIFADENKLYYDLVQDFTTYQLSNLEPSYDTEDLTRIEKLTKPLQVIKYLRNRIIKHRDKFENEYEKLEQVVNQLAIETPELARKVQEDTRLLFLAYLLDTGALDPETLEINPDAINENTGFRIKNETSWTRDKVNQVMNKIESWDSFINGITDPVLDSAIKNIAAHQGLTIRDEDLPQIRAEVREGIGVFVPTNFSQALQEAAFGKVGKGALHLGKGLLKYAKKAKTIAPDIPDSTQNLNKNTEQLNKNSDKLGNACKGPGCNNRAQLTGSALEQNIFTNGTKFNGKNLPSTSTPNSIMYKQDPQTKGITNYTEYGPDGGAIKRVDVVGLSHNGIPTPHVVPYKREVNPQTGKVFYKPDKRNVREALPNEVP